MSRNYQYLEAQDTFVAAGSLQGNRSRTPNPPLSCFSQRAGLRVCWDDAKVNPAVQLPCKVLVWQYSDEFGGGGGFDCNQANPNVDLNQEILAKLVLPPESAAIL